MAEATVRTAGGRSRRRRVLGPVLLVVMAMLVTFGVLERGQLRKLAFAHEKLVAPSSDYGLRRLLIDRREDALAAGDLEQAASLNALLAQEAVLRARAVHAAWMPLRDPHTKLFPQSRSKPYWNYANTAADFFCFLFLTAVYTDDPSISSLRQTFAAEAALAPPGALCQPVHWKTGRPTTGRHKELMFGASEYAKDGLLNLYEATGDPQVYDRLLQVIDAVLASSRQQSRFGLIPAVSSEVNGEMLQVLSRISLIAGRPAYGDMAAAIADAAIGQMLAANHGLPCHKFDYDADEPVDARARLRDHGSEIVGGLSEAYALAVSRLDDPAWQARADRWAEPLARMFELIVERAVDDAGLLISAVDAATGEQIDARPNDNWGYLMSGLLLFTQAAERHGRIDPARLAALLTRLDHIIAAVAATDGLEWEDANQDGYADAIESALYIAAHYPAAAAQLLPWIDDQIGILFDMQKDTGFVDAHYLDGNFMRTALLYADLRTGGWRIDPWDAATRIGMATDAAGRAVLTIQSRHGYQGVLRPQRSGILLREALPWNWPRLNSWPEWLPPSSIRGVTSAQGAAEAPTPQQLQAGWPISIPRGGRIVLHLDVSTQPQASR